MHLAALGLHPLKSGRALSPQAATVEPAGLRHDRRWMIVDAAGRFVSQREDPRLGRIVPAIDGDALRLSAPGAPDLTVPLRPADGPTRRVTIWDDEVAARGCGDAADAWVEEVLGPRHWLAVLADPAARPADPRYAREGDAVSFADGFPYLLTTTASLDELNRRAGTTLTMARFRPNLVVEGAAPFEEDRWRRIRIGEVVFRVAKPCARCVVTTLDPDTLEAGPEPLRTLARFRAADGKVFFGQNLLPDGGGTVRLGDPVEVIEVGTPHPVAPA
jgi:uncharacterized protein YcbX